MSRSYPFPIYSGVLEPEHYQKIGSAIWLFLWCVSSTTAEVERDGITWGIVLGNKPLKRKELAEPFNVSERTIQRWLDDLEKHEYIKVTRAPYGFILTVKNSKKFTNKRVDKNVQPETEETKMSSPEWTDVSSHVDKSVHSNKDITEDITNTITTKNDPVDLIAERFADLKTIQDGRPSYPSIEDYEAIVQVVVPGVSVSQTIELLDQCFDDFKKRKPNGRIASFNYCKDYILDHYEKLEAKENAKKLAERRISNEKTFHQYRGRSSQPEREDSITGGQLGWINRKRNTV